MVLLKVVATRGRSDEPPEAEGPREDRTFRSYLLPPPGRPARPHEFRGSVPASSPGQSPRIENPLCGTWWSLESIAAPSASGLKISECCECTIHIQINAAMQHAQGRRMVCRPAPEHSRGNSWDEASLVSPFRRFDKDSLGWARALPGFSRNGAAIPFGMHRLNPRFVC